MEKYVKLSDVIKALDKIKDSPIKQNKDETVLSAIILVSALPYIKIGEDGDKIHTILTIMKTKHGCGFGFREEQVGVKKICE